MKFTIRSWIILFTVGVSITTRSQDADYLVDQSYTFSVANVPPEFRFASIAPFARPVGPSFVPTLTSVNVFELHTSDAGAPDGIGAVLAVTIRDLSTRASIATSLPISLPDRFDGVARFNFSSPVLLTPGRTYMGEVNLLSASPNWGLTVEHTPSAIGNLIQAGAPFRANAWFREGMDFSVPEPGIGAILCIGVLVFGSQWKRCSAPMRVVNRGVRRVVSSFQ